MTKPPMEWSAILADAVSRPGVIAEAYSRFWNYSVGNQLLALFQCLGRQIEPGPINTFLGWKELGRAVKKGEKALTLCMPIVRKSREKIEQDQSATKDGSKTPGAMITRFVYRPHWFVLAQTDGQPYVPPPLPAWDEELALSKLMIERIPFRHTDGNVQGYAQARSVAVSPIALDPQPTLLHEIAHIVLGHTEEGHRLADGDERIPRDIREVEAECVALICCESLGLPGAEFSRGYIQHWLGRRPIPDRSVQRIFKAADAVLKAGQQPRTLSNPR